MVTSRPWTGKIAAFIPRANQFKERTALIKMLSDLMERECASVLDVFNGEQEIIFAILLQNLQHPHNNNRREAIKTGKYVDIDSSE